MFILFIVVIAVVPHSIQLKQISKKNVNNFDIWIFQSQIKQKWINKWTFSKKYMKHEFKVAFT